MYLNTSMKNYLSVNAYGKNISNTFKTLSDHNGSPTLRNLGLCVYVVLYTQKSELLEYSVFSTKYQIFSEKNPV